MRKIAFAIAGTHSGCGKTTVSLAVMTALRARGLSVQPFKVGPDFIDPGFHTQVTGRESRNLDGWMVGRAYSEALFSRLLATADAAVVEGVMGLFDGYDGLTESGSTAEMAKWLDLPVLLVVDARSMARSVAALVQGFTGFDPALRFAGVLFNRIGSPGHLDYLREAMSANLPGVPVLGGIPREASLGIPERHLGLVTAEEIRLDAEWREKTAALIEKTLDLDLLMRCAERDFDGPGKTVEGNPGPAPPPLIAVPRDAAYCFYYPDNLEMLEAAGARLHYFSPLAGESLPPEASGLYLGGGYPELFAGQITQNPRFLPDIRRAASRGMPVYAECGGLMTLAASIEATSGERFPMAGLLPFGVRMLTRRKALGYTEVKLTGRCLLGDPGEVLRGHEFHYSEIVAEPGEGEAPGLARVYELAKRKGGAARREGYASGSVLASYIHLHWGSAPEAPCRFVRECRAFAARREAEALDPVLSPPPSNATDPNP